MTIGGFTTQDFPIVLLRDMTTGAVFHAQSWKGSTSIYSLGSNSRTDCLEELAIDSSRGT